MPASIDLNISPYFDDWDELKNFHKFIFRPEVAIQARELTQLQDILQNQIERFGNHVFKDGTILTGCNFSFDPQYNYVKIADLLVDGQPSNPAQYANCFVASSANLVGMVIDYADGFESQNPDLKTLFIKYINTGVGGEKTYASSDVLNVYGRYANGEMNSSNTIAQVSVANSSYLNAVGTGYGFSVADGYIYQKGFFIRVEHQSIVVEKYSTAVQDKKIGFEVIESIVTENADTSLLSPAAGFSNENAPGAHRLKLEPALAVHLSANTPNTFFALVEFSNGNPVKQRENTEYNNLGRELSKRTFEESGNYVINPFALSASPITGNVTHLNVDVGSGLAYVDGFRVQQFGVGTTPIAKGTTVKEKQNQVLTTNYGNYILVKEMLGEIKFNTAGSITFYDVANAKLTNETFTISAAGTAMGTAKVRSIELDSGIPGNPDCVYKVYLFGVTMNAGKSFQDVKAISFTGTFNGVADVVLENSKAYVYETGFNRLVFPYGQKALKTLRDLSSNNDTSFTYRTVKDDLQFNTSGVITITQPSGFVYPYTAGGTLNDTQERDIVVMPVANGSSSNLTGTASYTNATAYLVGSGTTFLSDYRPGQYVRVNNGSQLKRVTGVVNNTYMTVSSNFVGTNTGSNYVRFYPQYVPINLQGASGGSIAIDGTGQTMTITLAAGLSATVNALAYFNVTKQTAIQLNKTVNKNVYIKIDCSNNVANTSGPYCLGLPDVFKIDAVYKANSFSGIEANGNLVTSQFTLDTGQTDNHYGLSYIKNNSGTALANTDKLLVKCSVFKEDSTGGGKGFFSVDSYPINDAAVTNTTIQTAEIPVYKSATGASYDLRDSIDFRPMVANTGVYGNSTNANTNPSITETFSGSERYFPAPNYNFSADIQYYLGRIDRVVMDSYGQVSIVQGTPAATPKAPDNLAGTISLATVTVPPYPSLSIEEGAALNRNDYATQFSYTQNRRYTMQDIGGLDQRLRNIEYYTSLSLLEKETKDLVIPSGIDASLDRFKNGIFVDPFNDFNVAAAGDNEFSASIFGGESFMGPSFSQDKFNLKVSLLSTTVQKGDTLMLPFNHTILINQPFATKQRNLTDQFYSFKGTLWLGDPVDNNYSVTSTPKVVTIDQASQMQDLIQNLNRFQSVFPLVTSVTSQDTQFVQFRHNRLTTTTTTNTQTTQQQLTTVPRNTEVHVGEFVTDVSFNPVIRAQRIYLLAKGMRPNSTVSVFFDKVLLDDYTAPCTLIDSTAPFLNGQINKNNFAFLNSNELKTTADGSFYAILFLPEDDTHKFYTGDRQVLITDVDDLNSFNAATTSAEATFRAFNTSVTKSDLTIATRGVDVQTTTNVVATNSQRVTSTIKVDPLAQTFVVASPTGENAEGIFISKIVVYFKKKSSTLGVTLDIRTTDNGYPAAQILPFSKKHLLSSQVSVSDNASQGTTFEFDTPVFLRNGYEYCFVLTPDGGNPDYLAHVAEIGGTDLLNTSQRVTQDWGDGTLFMSHNNSAWTALQNEDLKFTMYYASFTASTGSATLVNRDYEFITANTVNGTFIPGERVAKVSANATGNVSVTAGSSNVIGYGTSFLSTVSSGDYIQVAIANNTDVAKVYSVANNTFLTLYDQAVFTSNVAKYAKTPVGTVFSWDAQNNLLTIDDSTASNSTFKFTAGDVVLGDDSKANCVIQAVDNKVVSYFQPMINRIAFNGTAMALTGTTTSNSFNQVTGQNFSFNGTNYLSDNEIVVMSKSNEITSLSGGKSFKMDVAFAGDGATISPVLDTGGASIIYYKNLINNVSTNEWTLTGNATSKYISRTVTLADGLESEDIRVYLTAYKPAGTDVKVYVKFHNDQDDELFNTKSWTELELKTNLLSSSSDRNNYVELEYNMPSRPFVSTIGGVVSTTNASANIVGVSTTFQSNLAVGDVVLIENGSSLNYFVSAVSAIASNTALTLAGTVPFSQPTTNLYKLDRPREAYKNSQNDGIISYINSEGARFDTYKSFSIKIVLLADSTNLVPRCDDLRAIAMTM